MSKERDLSYEALAHVTSTDWDVGRGELNQALKAIRAQSPELEDIDLATEIVYRAKLYREFMGEGIYLTPSALAKHWLRVKEQAPKRQVVNAPPAGTKCLTCDGHGVVLALVREGGYEEYTPCPSCHASKQGEMMFL
jgi:hypothetical protein